MRSNLSGSRAVASWIAQLVVAAALLPTLAYQLAGVEESVRLFSQLGIEPWGRIGSALAQLVAGLMLFIPATAALGALLAMLLILAAIAAHLTVLGIDVQGDGGLLFALACVVLTGSAVVLWLRRAQLWILERRLRQLRGVRLQTNRKLP